MLIGLVSMSRDRECPFFLIFRERGLMQNSQQATFSWLIPFIPYLPIEALKNARDGLERCFTYARGRVTAYLESDEEKTGTLLTGYLDSKTGQLKAPYTEFSVAIAGHGFMSVPSFLPSRCHHTRRLTRQQHRRLRSLLHHHDLPPLSPRQKPHHGTTPPQRTQNSPPKLR